MMDHLKNVSLVKEMVPKSDYDALLARVRDLEERLHRQYTHDADLQTEDQLRARVRELEQERDRAAWQKRVEELRLALTDVAEMIQRERLDEAHARIRHALEGR